MDDDVILVGGQTGNVPGSRQYACGICGATVWLAPSGQQVVNSTPVSILCLKCAMKVSAGADAVEYGMTPGAARELAAWKKRN